MRIRPYAAGDETAVIALWEKCRLTRPWNGLGLPALSVPCGFSAAGLPIGLQLVGRPFDEATVLRAADAFQRLTDFHARRPVLA